MCPTKLQKDDDLRVLFPAFNRQLTLNTNHKTHLVLAFLKCGLVFCDNFTEDTKNSVKIKIYQETKIVSKVFTNEKLLTKCLSQVYFLYVPNKHYQCLFITIFYFEIKTGFLLISFD